MQRATQLYAIAIGSNRPHGHFGRPQQVVEAAIACLDQEFGLFDASTIILNPADGGAGRDFANAVALIESALDPPEMLARLKAIERAFGRRHGRRWGPRVLDLDIALWSGGSYRSRALTIPHPQLARRSFVLQPLLSIAPGWMVGPLKVRHLAYRLRRQPHFRKIVRATGGTRRRPSCPNNRLSIRGDSATASSFAKAAAASTG